MLILKDFKGSTKQSQEYNTPHDISPFSWHILGLDVLFFKQQIYLYVVDYYSKNF